MMFKDKVVAITGAAGGIGQSLCRFFAGEGAAIAAIDKSPQLEDFVRGLDASKSNAVGVVADVGDFRAVSKVFARVADELGAVDILINNAGFSEHPTFARTDPAGWQHDVNGNLNGAYYCAHAVLPAMQKKQGGSIIAIGSVNGLGALGDPAYSAAKAGMISLTRSLAIEYGRFNIRSNIVLPGTVRTPLWERRASK
ncbi:MAG: SDR family NAD(P)-dependent oxidoreductase, partial [Rhizobiales bacterium]|nr:SDR family NAD(P)-dependent oxidoreductase [Hyphomicrobiales bacterium]